MDAPPILQLVTHCWPTIDTSDRYGTYVLLPPIDSRKPLHLPPSYGSGLGPRVANVRGQNRRVCQGREGNTFPDSRQQHLGAAVNTPFRTHHCFFKGLTLLWYNNGSFTFRFLAPLARFSTPQPKSNDVPRMTNSLHSLKLSQSRTCACCG